VIEVPALVTFVYVALWARRYWHAGTAAASAATRGSRADFNLAS
jgi:hypothetical protein